MTDEPMQTSSLWNYYRVTFRFLTKLCASVPGNPELVKTYFAVKAAKAAKLKTPLATGGQTFVAIEEEVLETLPDTEETMSALVFQRAALEGSSEKVLVQRVGTVRAHLKDCSRQLSAQFSEGIPAEKGTKAEELKAKFSTRVLRGVYYDETKYWLPILQQGKPLTAPTGTYDKPVHVKGSRGEDRSALKCIEYVDPPSELRVDLKVLKGSVSQDALVQLFDYGGCHGYGGERSDGEGRYTASVEPIED